MIDEKQFTLTTPPRAGCVPKKITLEKFGANYRIRIKGQSDYLFIDSQDFKDLFIFLIKCTAYITKKGMV